MRWVQIAIVFVCGISQIGYPQETGEADDQTNVEDWLQFYDERASSLRVETKSSDASLTQRTLLTITDPQHRNRHGRLYLWLNDGMPEVIGAIKSHDAANVDRRMVSYEFHSLSHTPVAVSIATRRLWQCDQPGVEWTTISDAFGPHDSEVRRLVQMRSIARRYAVSSGEVRHPCRLMPRPLHRYSSEAQDVQDGAIFCFAKSTDPKKGASAVRGSGAAVAFGVRPCRAECTHDRARRQSGSVF